MKNNNKYIIVFDQYNNKRAPEGRIKTMINKILENKTISNNFCFIFIMTLNNKDNDIRQHKINSLFSINKNNNIIEINNIIYERKFNNIRYQNIYEKLGKTIKNYFNLKRTNKGGLTNFYK